MLFVGDDWAEDHHDVEVQDETGRRLGKARLPEGIVGVARLHELVARFAGDGPRVFRTAAWWLLCCLLPVQVLVVDLEWGLVAES